MRHDVLIQIKRHIFTLIRHDVLIPIRHHIFTLIKHDVFILIKHHVFTFLNKLSYLPEIFPQLLSGHLLLLSNPLFHIISYLLAQHCEHAMRNKAFAQL